MKLVMRSHPSALRLARLLDRFEDLTAVVWGDYVLDEYWRCGSRRVSREAPVLVLEFEGRTVQCGGAAHAALNLAALGARVRAVGWTGADAAGGELRSELHRRRVDLAGLLESEGGETIVKTRIAAGSSHTARQQVVRVDRGRPFPLDRASRARLLGAVERSSRGCDAIVLSDYGYGSVTPSLSAGAVARWRRGRLVVGLDARYALARYRGVTLATPNEDEAREASGIAIRDDADLAVAAERLRRRVRCTHLLVTRGRDGLTWWSGGEGLGLEAWGGRDAVDVTGAGDAVVATATLALAAGAKPLEAAALANVAGSVAVSRRGAIPVTASELRAALRRRGDRA